MQKQLDSTWTPIHIPSAVDDEYGDNQIHEHTIDPENHILKCIYTHRAKKKK